jgi:hypothetical protein
MSAGRSGANENHGGEEKCARQRAARPPEGWTREVMIMTLASDAEKRGDQGFPVKLRAGAEPRGERDEQQSQQIFWRAERHLSRVTISFARAPR